MVAKLIVHGADREGALARMSGALGELVIEGIQTNQAQQRWIIKNAKFRSGQFGTSYYNEIKEEVEHVR
jgi:acetyl/propionyl-CoA carboxylase alpha subunit